LVWASSDQIADSAAVTVRPSGRLNLGASNELVGGGSGVVLQSGLTGAASVTSTGTLSSLGITTALQANTLRNTAAPQIAGKFEMGTGARTISLQDTIGAVDLSVPAVISTTAFGTSTAGQITYQPAAGILGAPRLDLSGANTYTGAISIQNAAIMRDSGVF